ncbi:MAG: ribonuclease HII [Gammaproteobacteria bacterium]|nr:ribonuclease HII [Gammaproteobacteria bacterium]
MAAAVVLPGGAKPRQLRGLTDSKLLSAAERARFAAIIQRIGEVGIGMATVEEIDRLNIFHADMLAMGRAVEALGASPDAALVDGRAAPPLSCTVRPVVKGDRRSLSIAAASVVAKVTRDRLMQELAVRCPGYGWHTNVGYGTDAHYLGLLRKGPTPHHRQSFAPLTTLFGPDGPPLARFRYRALAGRPDVRGLELLQLRHDLHAVFDGAGHHLGQVKNLRGRWTFQAVGYGNDAEPVNGAGPCACCHGERLDAPERRALISLMTSMLG